MALIDKLFGRNKSLSDLSRQELRKEEILLTKQRDRLFAKMSKLGADKQKIFAGGAKEKSPEMRKALAQDFELKSQEQLMTARELNLRSKELMTVARLRIIKENNERGKALGRLKVTDRDVAKITGWIEDDTVGSDMYVQRLDAILELGASADAESLNGTTLNAAGQEVLDVWNQMDRGSVGDEKEGFERAEEAMRRRQASREGTS